MGAPGTATDDAMMNALLVYPRQPPTYWGSDFALDIVGVKSAFPPLGLLTIAAMFPPGYDLRVVDMNVTSLEDSDLEWADMVFTSTMIVQRISLENVIERCNRAGIPVVAGGPHPTTFHDEIEGVSHFVLDEVEETFREFLRDLEAGTAKGIYRAPRKPDVTQTPVPRFDLIDMNGYYSMGVQFSRGCPFDCEFCDIIKLYGQIARTKTPDQVVKEFDTIYELGWRGPVFLVDDNFIGNKREAMKLLPAIAAWQKERGHPFTLSTEASVNLSRMDELMDIMVEAGFDTVFLGIETPNPKALLKTKKPQNVSKRDDSYLFNAVRAIQGKGMQVQGGFILGLDGDDEGVFDAQIDFIREAGIPVAPIYLLTALRGTDMYERFRRENRLIDVPIGTSATTLNFKTEMDQDVLIEGYMRVTATLYDPPLENYLERCLNLLEHLKFVPHLYKPKSRNAVFADLMGVRSRLSAKQIPAFTKFIAKVSKEHPSMLAKAVRLAAMGYHFEKITRQQNTIRAFMHFLNAKLDEVGTTVTKGGQQVDEGRCRKEDALKRAKERHESIPEEFRYDGDGIEHAMASFRSELNARFDRHALAERN